MQQASRNSAIATRSLQHRGEWNAPRRAAFVVLAVAGLTFGLVAPALTTITPTSTALAIAQAIASSSVTLTGASFDTQPSGTPNGVSTSALGGFPVDGADYGILTSGDISSVDQPGTFATTDDGGAQRSRRLGLRRLSPERST